MELICLKDTLYDHVQMEVKIKNIAVNRLASFFNKRRHVKSLFLLNL